MSYADRWLTVSTLIYTWYISNDDVILNASYLVNSFGDHGGEGPRKRSRRPDWNDHEFITVLRSVDINVSDAEDDNHCIFVTAKSMDDLHKSLTNVMKRDDERERCVKGNILFVLSTILFYLNFSYRVGMQYRTTKRIE